MSFLGRIGSIPNPEIILHRVESSGIPLDTDSDCARLEPVCFRLSQGLGILVDMRLSLAFFRKTQPLGSKHIGNHRTLTDVPIQ